MREIRNLYAAKQLSMRSFGKLFEVFTTSIFKIVRRKTWRNVQ